jgi:hypothetical protein
MFKNFVLIKEDLNKLENFEQSSKLLMRPSNAIKFVLKKINHIIVFVKNSPPHIILK